MARLTTTSSTPPSATSCSRRSRCSRGRSDYDEEARAAVVDETATFLKRHEDTGVVVRGIYDVAGMRADADFMFWTHAERVESLQALYSDFRRTTTLGRATRPVWSSVALHRPAEFNKSHVPAFLAGEEPGNYVCVYPFVRSLDWYLLPDEERRKMLADHGMAARGYKDVRANTVPAFAPRRLRVDPGLRGARTAPHRRPDA